jgi:hypothetical protein
MQWLVEWASLLLFFRLPELSQFIWGSSLLSEQQPLRVSNKTPPHPNTMAGRDLREVLG